MADHDFQSTDIYERWRSDTQDEYADLTIKRYISTVERICRHHGLSDPHDLTADRIREYFRDRKCGPGTRRTYLCAIKAFVKWSGGTDPTAGIRRPRRTARRPKPITESQRDYLLSFFRLNCRHMYVATLLALYAGLRAAEIGRLRGEHIIPDPSGTGGILTVYDGKGGKTADVFIDSFLIQELEPEIRAGGYVLGKLVGGNLVSCRFLYWAKKRAGIDASIHMCRHWFITWTYRVKKDIVAARDQARHDSVATTEVYIESDADVARATASALPGASRAGQLVIVPSVTPPNVDELRAQLALDAEEFLTNMAIVYADYRRQEQQLAAVRTLLDGRTLDLESAA
ncbi:tyrosine-type recombinase/integrase (plasmid) [Streptomyces sp. BI20]|uniref:tyrosine-type recombinase/integrase n=1 Tax=Streptomyces sp. BI20 TaxID=3403460 RepID=UPI003C71738C